MLYFSRWKLLSIILFCLATCLVALFSLLPDHYKPFPDLKINLGLDLMGGVQILAQIDQDEYIVEQLSHLRDSLRSELREKKIKYKQLKVSNSNLDISFIIKNPEQINTIKTIIAKLGRDIKITINQDKATISYAEAYLALLKHDLLFQSIEILRKRIDSTGTKEPIIIQQGEDKILIQVPGLDNPTALKEVIGKTAKLTFHMVYDEYSKTNSYKTLKPVSDDKRNLSSSKIESKALLAGNALTHARASIGNRGPEVQIRFNSEGASKFARITKENINRRLAIVLDGQVISAPSISTPILDGNCVINGSFTTEEANNLALLIRVGALPASLSFIEERLVGPTLGQDSIDAGKIAAIIAILAVGGCMITLYGRYGLVANISLIFGLVLIFAALSIMEATLTMPGIAGIVLTLGMAVDANILIFEKIREEQKEYTLRAKVIERGFNKAYRTIMDSNITTMIMAVLLYIFGYGPIQGFAVTLIIGILASMFSSITLTRLMIIKFKL